MQLPRSWSVSGPAPGEYVTDTPFLLFISYASPDIAGVSTVRDDLEADGIGCWMAPYDLPAAADYAEIIPGVIRQAALVLLFLSRSANASDHVQREAHLAAGEKLHILPIRLEEVVPEGPLAYLLANIQWVNAFPRVEPSLDQIRREVRRLLQQSGKRIEVSKRRTPFQRVVASAAAWLTVAASMLLLLTWIQRMWFNLVPVVSVPFLAMRQAPLVIVALGAVPAAAIALQFWFHRNLSRALSLDVLLGLAPDTGVRLRSVMAAGLIGILAAAVWFAPATVSIRLENTPIDGYNPSLIRAMIGPIRNYVGQCGSHFVIVTRVGALNPPGRYTIRVELSPYATRDGIEFGDLLIDPRLGVTQAEPVADDRRKVGAVDINASFDLIAGRRTVRTRVTHYRDAAPADSRITASVALTGQLRVDAPPTTVPASVFCSP
jgi:hypothetical protein